MAPPDLILAPAPWACKFDTYWILFHSSGPLPDHAYSPLEQSFAPFSDPALAGQFKGGAGMIQICRYTESPVGPYDELLIIPGAFEVPRPQKKKHLRITRIYVDQKDTAYNGRKNWNVPKHLARFTFAKLSNPPRVKFQAFSPDIAVTTPFFSATIQPFQWAPAFPYSSTSLSFMGLDPTLVQPPLPASSKEGEEELCGTDRWASTGPLVQCKRAQLAWVEVEQPEGTGEEEVEVASWWPKTKPWRVGLCLENSKLEFPVPEVFE